MRYVRPLGFATLLVSLLIVAFLMLRRSGADAGAPRVDAGPPGAATLGAPPRANVAADVGAARRHVETQACLANCASEGQACQLTSEDQAKCAAERGACEAKCQ